MMQLGEIAYRAALQSPQMARLQQQQEEELSSILLTSPTGVTERLDVSHVYPCSVSSFDDVPTPMTEELPPIVDSRGSAESDPTVMDEKVVDSIDDDDDDQESTVAVSHPGTRSEILAHEQLQQQQQHSAPSLVPQHRQSLDQLLKGVASGKRGSEKDSEPPMNGGSLPSVPARINQTQAVKKIPVEEPKEEDNPVAFDATAGTIDTGIHGDVVPEDCPSSSKEDAGLVSKPESDALEVQRAVMLEGTLPLAPSPTTPQTPKTPKTPRSSQRRNSTFNELRAKFDSPSSITKSPNYQWRSTNKISTPLPPAPLTKKKKKDIKTEPVLDNSKLGIASLTKKEHDVKSDKAWDNAKSDIAPLAKEEHDVKSDQAWDNAKSDIAPSTKGEHDVKTEPVLDNFKSGIAPSTKIEQKDIKTEPALGISKAFIMHVVPQDAAATTAGSTPTSPSGATLLYEAVMTPSVHDIDSPLVALVSLFPQSMHEYLPRQSRVLLMFKALGIKPVYVDGSDPKEHERRNELFELSGKRGVYPQLFVRKMETGKLEYFADYNKIEALNDCQMLKETLEAACQ
jgi:hypothetical protein